MMFPGLRSRWATPRSCAALDGVGHGDGQFEEAGQRQTVLRQDPIQRLARGKFHDQEAASLDLLDGVDRDDVGVVQRGDGPGLALQAL